MITWVNEDWIYTGTYSIAKMDSIPNIYDRVLWRIHQERDVTRRGAIQGFPQQIENLKSIVDGFIKQTFVKNRYQFQPYLRGMYFTSGTQDGTPIDRMMTSVSSNFGFARETVQQPNTESKLCRFRSCCRYHVCCLGRQLYA